MNTRLHNLYSSIEQSNKDKFLDNQIVLDRTWGNSIWGVTLQIDLDEKVKNEIAAFQHELDCLEPNNFHLLPREYQHISFNQVVYWDGAYKFGTEKTWENISEKFLEAFQKQDGMYNSFKLVFSRLIATAEGIIWCGYDENDELENLREEFLNLLPFPEETTKLNHIIHTTVARYKNKLNNPQVVLNFLEKQTEIVQMSVNRISLKNELVFPSIKTEELAQITLV